MKLQFHHTKGRGIYLYRTFQNRIFLTPRRDNGRIIRELFRPQILFWSRLSERLPRRGIDYTKMGTMTWRPTSITPEINRSFLLPNELRAERRQTPRFCVKIVGSDTPKSVNTDLHRPHLQCIYSYLGEKPILFQKIGGFQMGSKIEHVMGKLWYIWGGSTGSL